MITIESIIKRDAQFVRNSGGCVEIDRRFPTVVITWFGDGEEFLNGHEAELFLADLAGIGESAPELSPEDIELHLARPYVECL